MFEPVKIVNESFIMPAFIESIFDASENQLITGAGALT